MLTVELADGSKTAVTLELPTSLTNLAPPPPDLVSSRELVAVLSQMPVNPAASESSVGGMWACAWSKCLKSRSFGGKRVVPSGGGNRKPLRIIKGIARDGAKTAVPHQLGIKCSVNHGWRPALVAWAPPAWPDEVVVFDADRHGLRITEAIERRVTAGAGIVAVKTNEFIEEEQSPQLSFRRIKLTAETLLQSALDFAGETIACEHLAQLSIYSAGGGVHREGARR